MNPNIFSKQILVYESRIPEMFRLPRYQGPDTQTAQKNLISLQERLGMPIKIPNQCHSDRVAVIGEQDNLTDIVEADALLTRRHDIALGIIASDCVPILLHDRAQNVIGAIHAGRLGTQKGITQKTLQKMQATFGTQIHHVHVYIGPSICSNCYEVSREDATGFQQKYFTPAGESGKVFLNLQQKNIDDVCSEGVPMENIEISPTCSYESLELHSYRRYTHTGYTGYGNNIFVLWMK